MASTTREYLERAFLHFAEVCEDRSPLYATLARRVAAAPRLLDLAADGAKGQPPPNLLFGAVHFLLLGGVEHPLRTFYPSVGGHDAPAHAWPRFRDFCHEHGRTVSDLIATRRVQTNEVGRCGLLMPGMAHAQQTLHRDLHLVEVGASAGLNLLFDRYRYEYGDQLAVGNASSVVIRTEVRGDVDFSIPDRLPTVAARVGVDISPVDVMNVDAMRWLEALVWPDDLERIRLFRSAREIAQRDPPHIVTGDGLDVLGRLLETVSADHLPCVYHSHTTYQMSGQWRAAFEELLDRLGRERDLAHVSLEWLGDDPGPRLYLTVWRGGRSIRMHLANCDHHGRWMARPTE